MLSSTSFASWHGNADRRCAFAIEQDITGSGSDGSQLRIAGSTASQVLVGLHELKALVPVHVCQGSSRSPAHACMSHCMVLRQLLTQAESLCRFSTVMLKTNLFCEEHLVKAQRGIV